MVIFTMGKKRRKFFANPRKWYKLFSLEVLRMALNSSPHVFLFLSRILGKKIVDREGRLWGRVSDVVVTIADLYPPVTAIFFSPAGRITEKALCGP